MNKKTGEKNHIDWIKNFKIMSYVKLDNFDPEEFTDKHAILDQKPIPLEDTLARLIRTCRDIKKVILHLKMKLQSEGASPEEIQSEINNAVYQEMFMVDYL